jgi:hypothetical protein
MEALEVKEKLEEAAEGHEGSRSTNLRIGLLIAALAALLALLEVTSLLRPKPSTRICKPQISGPSSRRKQPG